VLRSRERDDLATRLAEAQSRIAELESELANRTGRDSLSQSLLTLRGFRTQLAVDAQRAHRYGSPLAVALIDIDRFRQFNTRHGFAAGDEVLIAFSQMVAERMRINDLACHAGGDEFGIMLPETGAEGAAEAMQRLLVDLEELEAGGNRGFSASIGVAVLQAGQSPETLLAAARSAVEQARASGGGQVIVFAGTEAQGEGEVEPGNGDVIAALASALTERDQYTGDHSDSVVDLTARVGEAMAMRGDEVEALRTAALLHDIGKVGVPDEILHKPGPLDDKEWEIMRQHPVIGERILRAIPGMGAIARIVRHEHERWDGGGYPDQLRGEAIPLGARIILACDAYHAMVSDRPYRQAMSHKDAMAELHANAGTQFDPQVVEALVGYLYGQRQAGLNPV
jgi:diguanylate cyclase (GGDEF)-like protein/putative nucleotidyltransferase with HDIG domain